MASNITVNGNTIDSASPAHRYADASQSDFIYIKVRRRDWKLHDQTDITLIGLSSRRCCIRIQVIALNAMLETVYHTFSLVVNHQSEVTADLGEPGQWRLDRWAETESRLPRRPNPRGAPLL